MARRPYFCSRKYSFFVRCNAKFLNLLPVSAYVKINISPGEYFSKFVPINGISAERLLILLSWSVQTEAYTRIRPYNEHTGLGG